MRGKAERFLLNTQNTTLSVGDHEREVLFRVADGLSSSEIANEFEVSLATVNSQRINILKKLDVGSVRNLISLISRYRFAQRPLVPRTNTVAKMRR